MEAGTEIVEASPQPAATCVPRDSAPPTSTGPAPRATAAPRTSTAQHRPTHDFSPAPDHGRAPGPAEPLDLVTVPARQGLEAVDILQRAAATSMWSGAAGAETLAAGPTVGPVLHDGPCDTLGFLVPPGTADCWDLPGSACTQTLGRGVSFGNPGPGGPGDAGGPTPVAAGRPAGAPESAPPVPEPPVNGTGWLLPPTDTDHVTDPMVLRRALGEAARLIEAADRCR
ncbi:hypothetical protein [Streptomyces sp. NPDC051561]|uniref:hypothetical protein n=1 Tax=Streptomyces sp. NPDC051561 TaxID=3365658 RepID=UPI0037A88A2A